MMVAEAALAVPEWADATAERQQHAESAFMLADTSGDGLVDEGELLVLCEGLVTKHGANVARSALEAFLRGFRTEPSTPLELDFEAFVDVYNAFLLAQQRGALATNVPLLTQVCRTSSREWSVAP